MRPKSYLLNYFIFVLKFVSLFYYFIFKSDDNFFTINSLLANTTYNVSVTVVHSNNKYSVIAQQQQFTTLRRGYTPENVTEIKVTNFMEDKWNPMFLTATLTWKPAAGKYKKKTKNSNNLIVLNIILV